MAIITKVSLILLCIKSIGKLLIKLISVSFIWFTEWFNCGSCKVKNDDGGFPLSVSWWGGDVISQKWWMMVIWQTSIISVLDIVWWFFLFIFSYWLEVISLMVLACIYKFKFNLVDIWESFSIRHIFRTLVISDYIFILTNLKCNAIDIGI